MIIDTLNKKKYKKQNISETKLQKLIIENFEVIFPQFRILKSEKTIEGDVRQFGTSGRIDILAFNPVNLELIIFELKKKHSKNILFQAFDYVDFIEENLEKVVSQIKDLKFKKKTKNN